MKKKETLDLQGFPLVAETRDLCKLTRIEPRPVAVPDSDCANTICSSSSTAATATRQEPRKRGCSLAHRCDGSHSPRCIVPRTRSARSPPGTRRSQYNTISITKTKKDTVWCPFHFGCGDRDRTCDLRVMSPTSCLCSTPRYISRSLFDRLGAGNRDRTGTGN